MTTKQSRSRSFALQLAGVKSAIEALSAARLESNQDATTDHSPLLLRTTTAYKDKKKVEKKKRAGTKGLLSGLLKRDTNSVNPQAGGIVMNELQKKNFLNIQFDILITQFQSAQLSWINSFIAGDGISLLFSHLTEENYTDEGKQKFLPCLRCIQTIIQRTDAESFGLILKNENLLYLVKIFVWSQDLFLLSSTGMTLIDICENQSGFDHLWESLHKIQFPNQGITFPFVKVLRLINPNDTRKAVKICCEVILTLLNTFLMGITILQARFQLQSELLSYGIIPLLLEFVRNMPNIQGQLELFEQILTQDYNDTSAKLGLASSKQGNEEDTDKWFNVILSAIFDAKPLRLPYNAESTVQQILEILAVKQEYLGYPIEDLSQYALFCNDFVENGEYIELFEQTILNPQATLSSYGFLEEFTLYFQYRPWTLTIGDVETPDQIITVTVDPNSTVDVLVSILCASYNEIMEEDSQLNPSDYGIYWSEQEFWLQAASLLNFYKELPFEGNTLLFGAKIAPITIRFKDRSFTLEVRSQSSLIEDIFSTVTTKLGIPEEQLPKYGLFLDVKPDPSVQTFVSIDANLLDPSLSFGEVACMSNDHTNITFRLGIKPQKIRVEFCQNTEKILKEISVLFNQSLVEATAIICSAFGVDPDLFCLAKQEDGNYLDERQTFDSLQILPESQIFLVLRPVTTDDFMSGDVNIWEEERTEATFRTEIENGQVMVAAATLNQLVRKATSEEEYDSAFCSTFLATYRSFASPELLCRKFWQRYDAPENIAKPVKNVVQMRTIAMMKRWVEAFRDEEEYQALEKLITFIEKSSKGATERPKILSTLTSAMSKQRAEKKHFYFSNQPPPPRLPKDKPLECLVFDDLDLLEVARQLTLVSFEAYSRIRPAEFFGQPWSHPKLHALCPNLMEMINHFNYVARAVGSMLVSEPKVRQRAKLFEKFILLGEHFKNLNNYSLLTAVVSGLNCSAIGRLSWTKARVPSRSMMILESLEELTSMHNSYKNYRNALLEKEPPLIPYLGVHLQDLTFIEDGNTSLVDGLINFSKLTLVNGNVLAKIVMFQQTAYNLVTVPIVRALLENLPQLDEDTMYKLSLEREPRNATKNEIE